MNNDIQKNLDADARQIEVFNPDVNDPAALAAWTETLRIFIAENGFSQRKVADFVGYSSSVISGVLAGTYTGDLRAVVEKLTGLMNNIARRQRRAKSGFVSTTTSQRIKTLIVQTVALSSEEGAIGLVIGDSGHGKSVCLQQFAGVDKNTVFVELDSTMRIHEIFSAIAGRLRGVDTEGTLPVLSARLVDELEKRHIAVLLDECSSLRIKDLDKLRQVICVKSHCPLILAGNADLLKTIQDESGRRGYASLDQFYSRLTAVLNLDELADIDGGDGLYTAEDVRRLYEYGGIRLTADAVDTLKRICKTPKSGRLRTCSMIIQALLTSPVIGAGSVDGFIIRAAIRQLGLPVMDRLPLVFFNEEKGRSRAAATA
jgi:DNA transposition AAA+ family ATPase